jgi:opacity protein-like surface antigen
MRYAGVFGVVLAVAAFPMSSRGADSETGVDLSGLSEVGSVSMFDEVATDVPFDDVDYGNRRPTRRFYVTGIVGASFGTLQSGGFNSAGSFDNIGQAAQTLFTAGGAAGMAFARSNGQLRLELEGRGRETLTGTTESFAPPTPIFFYDVRATDGWSVMSNVWRDWNVTRRLGVYGGGGIGAGGYHLSVDDTVVAGEGDVGAFAWQLGVGTTYKLTDRATIDLGYRFFDTITGGVALSEPGIGPAGSYLSNYYASELLLSVRIYEPFRGFRDR